MCILGIYRYNKFNMELNNIQYKSFRKPPIQRKVGWMKNIIFATVLKFT